MRLLSLMSVCTLVACTVEDAPRDYPYAAPVQQITTTQVNVGQAITATSRDGSFGIHFTAGSFAEPVSVQINQGNSSPAPAVTLSRAYSVSVTPASATLQQPVDVSFVMAAAAVTAAGGESNLRVGHGEILGQPWYEALAATYDSSLGRLTVTTSSFSYFLVFDYQGFNACSCDVDSGCQVGCEFCDADCEAPGCVNDTDCETLCCIDGACMQSGYCEEPECYEDAECETDCCLSNVCMSSSYCEEPECTYDYDCETNCCLEGTCMPSSTCGTPVACYEDYDCESGCCVEGVCEPSNVCNPGGCTYDYDCETECCVDNGCMPSSYCVASCYYDSDCETECCYDGICADASYCVDTCVYDTDCASNCCVEGICASASECATCVTGALRCSDNWVQECVGGEWSYAGSQSQDCGALGQTCVDYPSDSWATCESVGCDPATEWQCSNGDCIPAEYRCDRYTEGPDCVDGSDEDPYCPTCMTIEDCPVGDYWQCDTSTGTCYQGV